MLQLDVRVLVCSYVGLGSLDLGGALPPRRASLVSPPERALVVEGCPALVEKFQLARFVGVVEEQPGTGH